MKKNSFSQQVLVPKRVERLSPGDFVTLVDEQRSNIASSRFVAPRIGGKGFGSFEVRYKVPVLKKA